MSHISEKKKLTKELTKEDEIHPANRIHSSYVDGAQSRELSQAYLRGIRAFQFDGGYYLSDRDFVFSDKSSLGKNRWVRKMANERVKTDASGPERFRDRVENWPSPNQFRDSLITGSAKPFDAPIVFDGWGDKVLDRLNGKDGGVDGAGSSMINWYKQTFMKKIFSGINFGLVSIFDERSVLLHVDADRLIDWNFTYMSEGIVLTNATIESFSDNGALIRSVYEYDIESKIVKITEYINDAKASYSYVLYAPCRASDIMFHGWEENQGTAITYERVSGIPLVAFQTSWDQHYQSPAPFEDAAALQLRADKNLSRVDAYRVDVTNSAFISASGVGKDEDGLTNELDTDGKAMSFSDAQGKAAWQMIPPGTLSEEMDEIKETQNQVENKCLNTMDSTHTGDVKALETAIKDHRSMTWLSLCYEDDAAKLSRLAVFMTELGNESVPKEASVVIVKPRNIVSKQELIEKAEKWVTTLAGDGSPLINRKIFNKLVLDGSDIIPEGMKEKIEEMFQLYLTEIESKKSLVLDNSESVDSSVNDDSVESGDDDNEKDDKLEDKVD